MPTDRPTSRGQDRFARTRVAPGGFSALLLLAVTVQMSLAMLEWAGPASADTRQRLATTIVAAAHRGVFTEPARAERPRAARPLAGPVVGHPASPAVGAPTADALRRLTPGWRTGLPPPTA